MILGIGVDLAEVDRIRQAVERHGNRFLKRVFTTGELAYCNAKQVRSQCLAARFAAKEATFKALGKGWGGGMRWQDVEIVNEPSGRPCLLLHGRARELADQQGVKQTFVSLSHTGTFTIAQVVLEG